MQFVPSLRPYSSQRAALPGLSLRPRQARMRTAFARARRPNMRSAPLRSARASAVLRDLLKLSKYRLSGLVAITSAAGFIARADPDDSDPECQRIASTAYTRTLLATTAGTWLAAASANTLNQLYEIRTDALMPRTRLRPLPTARLRPAHALAFAALTGVTGLSVLLHETNPVTTAIAAANIALYAAVYTPLKPISTANTWVGAIVGALPPIHGWAAASNGRLSGHRERGALAFGSLLFLWQIPHFHALAVVAREDYARGGLKMLAVSNPVANAAWARVTAAIMVPIGSLFSFTGVSSGAFGWEAAALAWWMYRGAVRLEKSPTSIPAARNLFRASIVYLPITLAMMLAHRVPYQQPVQQPVQTHPAKELRFYHPWQIMAPFPFLPVPCGVPAVVLETRGT